MRREVIEGWDIQPGSLGAEPDNRTAIDRGYLQESAATAKIVEAGGAGGPEELTSQFRLSQHWHVSTRFLLPPYY
jgi:hypothetical protein